MGGLHLGFPILVNYHLGCRVQAIIPDKSYQITKLRWVAKGFHRFRVLMTQISL